MNKRLLLCAQLLARSGKEHDTAADIGADHAYLACYLVQNGICRRAVAADINPAPLEAARKNIALCGLDDKVKAVLSDGLENITPDGITDIICAGMGGELISQIILRYEWVKGCTLILQPMTKADRLREALYQNGFYISREQACRDGRFIYSAMCAEYAPEKIDYKCDEQYLAIGRVSADEPFGAEYISAAARRLARAADGMAKDEKLRQKAQTVMQTAQRLMAQTGEKL